jgi:F420H(2)-dependent quinone reductase
MAYLKPNVFVQKVFNPLAMMFGVGGATTLAVAGRKTGEMQKVPVIVAEHEGSRYLVCPRGETEWVRNLRAAGGKGELGKGDKAEAFTASEVPVEQRAPIIAAYQKKAGNTVKGYFSQLPDPADHPVFRIEPLQTGRSGPSA